MKHNSLPVPDIPNIDPSQIVPQTASIAAILAVAAGWVPIIVAIIPAIYYAFLIWETKTVQGWLKRRAAKKRLKRIVKSKRRKVSRVSRDPEA